MADAEVVGGTVLSVVVGILSVVVGVLCVGVSCHLGKRERHGRRAACLSEEIVFSHRAVSADSKTSSKVRECEGRRAVPGAERGPKRREECRVGGAADTRSFKGAPARWSGCGC